MPLVRDVSKKELFVNIVLLIQVRRRTTILLIINITSSTFIMSHASVLFCQSKNSLFPKTNPHLLSIKPGDLPSPLRHYLPWTLLMPIRPRPSKSVDVHLWLVQTVARANSRSVNLLQKSHTLAHIIPVSSTQVVWWCLLWEMCQRRSFLWISSCWSKFGLEQPYF